MSPPQSVISPVADGQSPAAGRKPASRILLVQLRYMGDVLLCTPAIRSIRKAYPEARIELLTASPGADALAGNPHLDGILVWQPGWRAQWALAREIRHRGYTLVVDFQSTPRTARLVRATRAPRRVGIRGRGPRNWSYTDLVPKVRGPVYTARQKVGVLAPLNIHAPAGDDLSLDIIVSAADREWAETVWKRWGLDGARPVVAISPVSREPFKQWGTDRWAEVADALAAAGAKLLLTAGPGERSQVEEVVRRMHHPAVWDYGRTTLRQLAALYERCELWVGNDGGAKHVAAAIATPTITVIRWPLGPVWTDTQNRVPHRYVEREPPAESRGRRRESSARASLRAVTSAEVMEAAIESLRLRGVEPRESA